MNTLSTIGWHSCQSIFKQYKQRLYRLSILMIVFGLVAANSSAQTVANIDIQLSTENEFYVAEYQQGETPQLNIGVSRDSYVYVFSIDTNLRYAQVLPNSFEPNNYVFAVQGASYPSFEGSYSFSLEGMQGFTTLFAIASPRAISEARLERYVQKYLLFAEAYSDPAKLANVVIGPDIGSDISYLRVSGNQVTQSSSNTVPLNPSYYQLDYALTGTLDAVTGAVTGLGTSYPPQSYETVNSENYNSADYGAEYATGAYATAEYYEVLKSYQASLNIYNTYTDTAPVVSGTTSETTASATTATTQSSTVEASSSTGSTGNSQDYEYRQTITLTGVDTEVAGVDTTVASVEPTTFQNSTVQASTISIQPAATASYAATQTPNTQTTQAPAQATLQPIQQATPQPIQQPAQATLQSAQSATTSSSLTSQIVLTSPIAASTATPPSVVEQSLQSAVTTSPFTSWVAQNLENYSFVFQQYCYCSDDYLYAMIVTVENGVVSRVQYLENNQDVPTYVFESVPSIEDLFFGIAEIRVEGLTTVNVAYDQNFSFPNDVYFVNNPQTEIDDVSYQISNFAVR